MTKITLQDISSLTNEQSAITQMNNNSEVLETSSDNFLSRDGTSPNQMLADLDMNSNRILNLLDGVNAQEPATVSQVDDLIQNLVLSGSSLSGVVDAGKYLSLEDANTAAGSTKLLFIPQAFAILSNITFNCPVYATSAGIISIPTGVTATFNKGFSGSISQHFSCSGTGKVTFNYGFITEGYIEWWGAVAGLDTADNYNVTLSSWNAAVIALPKIRLMQATYHFPSTAKVNKDNITIQGARGYSQYDAPFMNTLLVFHGNSQTALQIGLDDDPGSTTNFLTGIEVHDVDVYCADGPYPGAPGDEFTGSKGVSLQFVKFPYISNITASQFSIGFAFNGSQGIRAERLMVHRDRVGGGTYGNTVHDYYYGVWVNGNATSHFDSGGNASSYISSCYVDFAGTGVVLGTTIGLYADTRWSDTFVDYFEAGAVQYGMWFDGTGPSGDRSTNLDLHIRDPILDQIKIVGLYFTNSNPASQITIVNPYVAPSAGALAGIKFSSCGGTARISGGICPGAAGPIGLHILSSSGVVTEGNSFLEFSKPCEVTSSQSCYLADIFNNQTQTTAQSAIKVTTSGSCVFRPMIKGASGKFIGGVEEVGTGNSNNTVDITGIDPVAIAT